MAEKTVVRSGGPGCATLLTVLFVGLKLTGHIDWSWWWVLSPVWGPAALAGLFFVGALLFVVARGD